MDRSEHALVPGWLKNTSGSGNSNSSGGSSSGSSRGVSGGSGNNGGGVLSHFADDNANTVLGRNRISTNNGSPRSSYSLERATPPFSNRYSNSNGSLTHVKDHPYSSFGRSRDRDCYRDCGRSRDLPDIYEKGRPFERDHWDRRDAPRRSYIVPGKRNEVVPRRETNGIGSKSSFIGGSATGRLQKISFEREFPSLGVNEKQGGNDNAKIASPVQSLPMGNSVVIGGDSWTSALAEVPVIIGGSTVAVPQSAPASSTTEVSMVTSGLNMAETIAQASPRANSAPQISVETQKLKELALKKSMQLVPMVPSLPKYLNKNHVNQSLRAPTNAGKLLSKIARERNGLFPAPKDIPSPALSNPVSVVPSKAYPVPPTLGNPINKRPKTLSPLKEKKTALAQNQSRHDFFNLMRKKASSVSSTVSDLSPKSTISDGLAEPVSEIVTSLDSLQISEKTDDSVCNGNACEDPKVFNKDDEKHIAAIENAYPEDEMDAFLRLLGWDENAADEDGLTEEEISAFYKEYSNLKPSLKLSSMPESNVNNCDSHSSGLGNFDSGSGSSGLSSSDSDSEA